MNNGVYLDEYVIKIYEQGGKRLATAVLVILKASGELNGVFRPNEEQNILYYLSAIGKILCSEENVISYLRIRRKVMGERKHLSPLDLINRGSLEIPFEWYYQYEYGIYV